MPAFSPLSITHSLHSHSVIHINHTIYLEGVFLPPHPLHAQAHTRVSFMLPFLCFNNTIRMPCWTQKDSSPNTHGWETSRSDFYHFHCDFWSTVCSGSSDVGKLLFLDCPMLGSRSSAFFSMPPEYLKPAKRVHKPDTTSLSSLVMMLVGSPHPKPPPPSLSE